MSLPMRARPLRGLSVPVMVAVSVGLGLASGCVSRGDYEACRTESDRRALSVRSHIHQQDDLEIRVDQLSEANEAMSRTMLALAADTEQAETDRDATRESLRRARRALALLARDRGGSSELDRTSRSLDSAEVVLDEAEARGAAARRRAETLHALLTGTRDLVESGQVRVRVARGRIFVEVRERALFRGRGATLSAGGRRIIERLHEVLAPIEGRSFQIAGHSAAPASPRAAASSWRLSAGRALSVARVLLRRGMAAERLSVAGFGASQPLDASPPGRAATSSGRVEIVLLPTPEELPDLSVLEPSVEAGRRATEAEANVTLR